MKKLIAGVLIAVVALSLYVLGDIMGKAYLDTARSNYLGVTIEDPSCYVYMEHSQMSGPCNPGIPNTKISLKVTNVTYEGLPFGLTARIYLDATVTAQTPLDLVVKDKGGSKFQLETAGSEKPEVYFLEIYLPFPPPPGLKNVLNLRIQEVILKRD